MKNFSEQIQKYTISTALQTVEANDVLKSVSIERDPMIRHSKKQLLRTTQTKSFLVSKLHVKSKSL